VAHTTSADTSTWPFPTELLLQVDALYFAVVTSTSVGYGDITAQSDSGKLFLIFYMFGSTAIVAGILGTLIDL